MPDSLSPPLPDAMLGLVAEFSQEPFIEGKEFISPMRGVLNSGPHPPRRRASC
jgi:hypothetical protein